MPIYEYLCRKCGNFEVTQKITDNALAKCPNCRQPVKKLISNCSFQLKGTGWYVTDFAKKEKAPENGKAAQSPATAAKENGKAGTGSAADKKTSGETKPAGEKKPTSSKSSESSTS
ncbi:MAG: FmdB family zinc ribbon protein [Candidatus Binatia bacterium]